MKSNVLNIQGKKVGEIELPEQFKEEIREDLIKRAVLAIQSHKRQPYGSDPRAGLKHVVYWSKRRRAYRGLYGRGGSRTPMKIVFRRGRQMFGPGGEAPLTVGGRRAHPPKTLKKWSEKINDKERVKAIRSAISATISPERVEKRHAVNRSEINLPIIVEDKLAGLKKTKEVLEVLKSLGLEKELERASMKKVRPGKGKTRGRRYKKRKGPLIVIEGDMGVIRASKNIAGLEVSKVENLNAEILAPGTQPGRLVVWTRSAIEKLGKEKMFLGKK